MKIKLKSSSGKSLVVNVSPQDTFVDLQARTLQKTGCLLNLGHFKLKDREIKAEDNVLKYYQEVTRELQTGEVTEEAVTEEAFRLEDEVVAKSMTLNSQKMDTSELLANDIKSRQDNSNRVYKSTKIVKSMSCTDIENSKNVSYLKMKQHEGLIRNGPESVSQKYSSNKYLSEIRNYELQENSEEKSQHFVDTELIDSQNNSSANGRTSNCDVQDCLKMFPDGSTTQPLQVEKSINKFPEDTVPYSGTSSVKHSEDVLATNSRHTLLDGIICVKDVNADTMKENSGIYIKNSNLINTRKKLMLQHANNVTGLYSNNVKDELSMANDGEVSKPNSPPEDNTRNMKEMETSKSTGSLLLKSAINLIDSVTLDSGEPGVSSNHTNMTSKEKASGCETNTDEDVDPGHPGQLCRLCALPRDTMIYIYSEKGVRLGLRRKINTWLPTHVSRTDPLPKQVCSLCIEKLDFCQDFGTECIKAEQILAKLFETQQFRCHMYIRGKVDASPKKKYICKKIQETKLLSDSDRKSSNREKSNRTSQIKNCKSSFVKSENLSSEDEESSFRMSEDSSENELMDMILDGNYGGERVTTPTEYCCPLCCEGSMVTMATSIRDSNLSTNSSESLVLTSRNDSESSDELDMNKFPNISDISKMELFRYVSAEYLLRDSDTTYENLIKQGCESDSENNSFIFDKVKEENEAVSGAGEQVEEVNNENDEDINIKLENLEESSVSCFICGETVSNLNQCLIHALRFHCDSEQQSYACSQCEMCFSVDTDMTRHFMTAHQNMKVARLLHICILCGRHCASQRALRSHVCMPLDSVPDQLACKTCGQSFSTKARLVFHSQFHGPDARPLECVPCAMAFTEEDNLYDHIRFSHRGETFICSECGRHFNSKAALRGHLRSHRNLRHHKCDVCNKTFLDKQTLKEHAVSHMEVKPFQCNICGKYLNRNSRLKKHLMSHEMQKTTSPQECYQCTSCGETFPDQPKAVSHAQIGHLLPNESDCVFQLCPIDKVYRCEFCERCYADPSYLNTHRSSHINESLPYKCHICGTGFATFARVATHKVTHGVYEKKDEFSIPKFYLCDACDKAYIHWTYLSVHRKMIHAEVKHMYKCKLCPEQFVNSWSLAYHRKTRHCDVQSSPLNSDFPANERKRWKCEYCDKRYVSHPSLLAHVSMLHTGDYPGPSFQCDECGKRFARKISLDSHKKTHDGTKPYVCRVCNKTFVHSSGLSSHLRLHRGDKPHSCEYCGKTFLQRGDRDDHVRKHTGERPFSCQHCPKSFRTRAMWFEHTRIHRDERPFPCDICGAAFRRSYALKNHKTIHTGERPHVCDVCGRAFRQKQDMQKHVKNNHQDVDGQEQDEDQELTPRPLPIALVMPVI